MKKPYWTCLYCGKPLRDMWERCGCEASERASKQCQLFLLGLVTLLLLIWALGWFLT